MPTVFSPTAETSNGKQMRVRGKKALDITVT